MNPVTFSNVEVWDVNILVTLKIQTLEMSNECHPVTLTMPHPCDLCPLLTSVSHGGILIKGVWTLQVGSLHSLPRRQEALEHEFGFIDMSVVLSWLTQHRTTGG